MEKLMSITLERKKYLDEVEKAEAKHRNIRFLAGCCLVRKMKEKKITCGEIVDALHGSLGLSKSHLSGALSAYRAGDLYTDGSRMAARINLEIAETGRARIIPFEGLAGERMRKIMKYVNSK